MNIWLSVAEDISRVCGLAPIVGRQAQLLRLENSQHVQLLSDFGREASDICVQMGKFLPLVIHKTLTPSLFYEKILSPSRGRCNSWSLSAFRAEHDHHSHHRRKNESRFARFHANQRT